MSRGGKMKGWLCMKCSQFEPMGVMAIALVLARSDWFRRSS